MSGSIGGFSPVDLYQLYAAKESTYANNALKANPQEQNLVTYFNANAASVSTPQQLLDNYKLLTVVLTAFNLQGSINDTALLKQLMTQNPASTSSLAQKLQNSSYLLFAKAMSSWSAQMAFSKTVTIGAFSPQASGTADTDAALRIATGTGTNAHTYSFEFTDSAYTSIALQSPQSASTTVVAVPIDSATTTPTKAVSQLITALKGKGFSVAETSSGALSIVGNDIQTAAFGTVSGGDFTAETVTNGVAANGVTVTTTPPFYSEADRAQVIQSYVTNTFETSADAQAPGLANALYFTREMASIKSISALQSDPTLLKVAVATTGITYDQYVELNFNQQTDLLTKALKPSEFQTPKYIQQVAEQYLIQQSSTSGVSAPPPGTVASLFSDSSDTSGEGVLSILDPGANLENSDDSGGGSVLSLFA
jgi:hypothetical protein